MRYMLDTNIVSDILRNPTGHAASRTKAAANEVCISIIVAAELRFGAAKKPSTRLTPVIESFLTEIPVFPFDIPADATYARLRTDLERAGRPIGAYDMLIAAHALALNLTLVTANTGEFQRVPGLTIENWLL